MNSLRRNIPYFLAIVAMILLIYLDFNVSQSLKLETDFTKDTARISELTPPSLVEKNIIKGDQVFFKAHLPSVYDRADFSFEFSGLGEREVIVGLVEPSGINQRQKANGSIIFNLPQTNELKFAILSSSANPENPVTLTKLKARFYRDHLGITDYIKIWIQRLNSIL